MASVERMTWTAAIPAHAKRVVRAGKPYACWTDRKAQSVVAPVLPSGKCRRTVAKKWVGVYRDHNGKRCKTKPFGDRSAALSAALAGERHAQAVRDGRATPQAPGSRSHLVDHLPDYLAHLEAKGVTEKHRGRVERTIRTIITRHGLSTAAKVDCKALQDRLEMDRLAGLDVRKGRKPGGELSIRARNKWVGALRTFGRWLSLPHGNAPPRTVDNPFGGLQLGNVETARKRVRRSLTVEEFETLLSSTRKSKAEIAGLTGADRARLYTVAAYTGLRLGALIRLTPEAFTWAGGVPAAVFSSARLQKNRNAHGVPLAASVGKELAPWLKARPPGKPLWECHSHLRSAEMIRNDLKAAGVPYANAAGEVFDFHALRLQFGFMLAQAGVPLVAAQQLLDHSTPVLTAKIYSRFGGELAGEVAKLPALGGTPAPLGTPLGPQVGGGRRNPRIKGGGAKGAKPKETAKKAGKRKK